MNMPDINGFELLELLRSSNVGNSPTIPERVVEKIFYGNAVRFFSENL